MELRKSVDVNWGGRVIEGGIDRESGSVEVDFTALEAY